MGGGSSKTSPNPPPPPTPTPDIDVAANAAELALKGQPVQAYASSVAEDEERARKHDKGTLGTPPAERMPGDYGARKKKKSSASMMAPAGGSLTSSAVLTG